MGKNNLIYTILVLSVGILITLFTVWIYHDMKKKQMTLYISMFVRFYGESRNVLETLQRVSDYYSKSSRIYLAIRTAIGYLECSAIADYKTAFSFIEATISNTRVKEIHDACIKEEGKKRQYLLTWKGEEGCH